MRLATLWAVMCIVLAAAAARAQSTVSFARGNDLIAGSAPIALTAADFNGDGNTDLAAANYDSEDVTVFWGDGHGSFADTSLSVPVGGPAPAAITEADFNSDQKLDVLTANEIDNTVSVLLNAGGTSFETAKISDTGGSPESVRAGDFDGDGKPDVATADNFDGTVTILHGLGDGTFSILQSITVGPEPWALAVADLNRDLKPDLVVTSVSGGPQGTGTITVLKGLGNGMFEAQSETSSTTFNVPVAVTSADLNGDSNLDIIVVNQEADTVSLLLGNGDLTFQPATTAAVGSVPEGVVAADFNGDGNTDVATSSNFGDKVSVLLGKGHGTFAPAVDFEVGAAPFGIIAADFDHDGKLDIATANMEDGSVSVLLNTTGTGPTVTPGPTPTPTPVADGCIGNCNRNGEVTVDELITMVNIALGSQLLSVCPAGDADGNGEITVNEIITAVNNALNGCPR